MRLAILVLVLTTLPAAAFAAIPVVVNPLGTGDHATIQAAIDAASAGAIIELADGTYTGAGNRDLDFKGKAITVRSMSGRPAACVIDCQGLGRGFRFHTLETNASVLKGITIRNGEADDGAGILVEGASPTLVHLVIEHGHASGSGGGLNTRSSAGSEPRVNDVVIANNSADGYGGGVYAYGGTPEFWNLLVTGNHAARGGGFYEDGADIALRSSTVDGNEATYAGGGSALHGVSGGGATLTDCIVWSNPGPIPMIVSADVSYSCVSLGYAGTGNISSAPQFVTGPGGAYHLATASPCVNAGSANAGTLTFAGGDGTVALSMLTTRADETNDRGVADMGYHHRHTDPVIVPDRYAYIQAAIDSALSGETIQVRAGVWPAILDFRGKAITLRNLPGQTVTLDGGDAGRVVTFDQSEGWGSVLEGVTVTAGRSDYGGGVSASSASPTLRTVVLHSNHATQQGGAGSFEFGRPRILGCTVHTNSADVSGGGFQFSGGGARPLIEDTELRQNTAPDGGAVRGVWATARIARCSFIDDWAATGGAISLYAGGTTVDSSTFVQCHATGGAGAIQAADGALTLSRSIIAFGADGPAVTCTGTQTVTVSCCDVYGNTEGDWTGCLSGRLGVSGNVSADPLFCDLAGRDLHLHDNSPCAPAANPGCGGIGRFGASCGPTTITVLPGGGGGAATIQAAIDASYEGGVVLLGDGTYTGTGNRDVDFHGKAVLVRSQADDPARVIVDCQASSADPHRGFIFTTGEDSASVLRAVTIRNAYHGYGAGVYFAGAAAGKLERCVIENCHASVDGGGVGIFVTSSPVLADCRIVECEADDAGGGLMVHSGAPTLRGCVVESCWSHWGAGGMHLYSASPTVLGCEFQANHSDNWGGALHIDQPGSQPVVTNTAFWMNHAAQGGALYMRNGARGTFTSCTFSGNEGPQGSQLRLLSAADPDFTRCIFASGVTGAAAACEAGTTPLFSCTDIHGHPGGNWTDLIAPQGAVNGNFSLDPLLCDAAHGDLRLHDASPCRPASQPTCGLIGSSPLTCSSTGVDDGIPAAARVRLLPCRPNPFSGRTTLRFDLPTAGPTRVEVFAADGRRVATLVDGVLESGRHEATWAGSDARGRAAAPGVYFVQVRAAAGSDRTVLVRTR